MTGTRVGSAAAVAVVAADVVAGFGFVVGFNQLATQSPVDAILPVALFSVGIAGLLALVAAVLGSGSPAVDCRPGALAPPSFDQGVAAFALGLLALAAVGWTWGVAAQAALVGAQGIALLLSAERAAVLSVRDAPDRPSTYRLGVLVAEAVLLIAFAGAALADAGIGPFT